MPRRCPACARRGKRALKVVEVLEDGTIVEEGAEAEQALAAWGYKPAEASRLVSAVDSDDIDSSEMLIRAALQAAMR